MSVADVHKLVVLANKTIVYIPVIRVTNKPSPRFPILSKSGSKVKIRLSRYRGLSCNYKNKNEVYKCIFHNMRI